MARFRYDSSPKGKHRHYRYSRSPKGVARTFRYETKGRLNGPAAQDD